MEIKVFWLGFWILIPKVLNAVLEPGSFVRWRERLPFQIGDPIPQCDTVCHLKCGPKHHGVSICSSFLGAVDPIPEITNSTETEVIEK